MIVINAGTAVNGFLKSISLTLGMIVYIVVVELLGEVFINIKNKSTIIGLVLGVFCLLLAYLVGEVL